jgi:hypothetical protein
VPISGGTDIVRIFSARRGEAERFGSYSLSFWVETMAAVGAAELAILTRRKGAPRVNATRHLFSCVSNPVASFTSWNCYFLRRVGVPERGDSGWDGRVETRNPRVQYSKS